MGLALVPSLLSVPLPLSPLTEIVEHDVPPEDQPPVQEEPHSIPVPVPDRTEQGPAQQSPSNYEAFAGFFSGIASAVQSTVCAALTLYIYSTVSLLSPTSLASRFWQTEE